eukprot:9262044-Pyramimonas_sp.AAC.1
MQTSDMLLRRSTLGRRKRTERAAMHNRNRCRPQRKIWWRTNPRSMLEKTLCPLAYILDSAGPPYMSLHPRPN